LEKRVQILRDWLLWCVLRIALVGVELADIHQQAYSIKSPKIPPGSLRSEDAHFIYAQQEAASQHTDDKIKQLLTLASSFATFLVAIGPGFTRLLLLPLAAVVFLCIAALGVRTGSLPDLSPSESDRNGQTWTRDLIRAVQINRGSHFYRVDLYRGARRWFLITFFMMPMILMLQHSDLRTVLRRPREAISGTSVGFKAYSECCIGLSNHQPIANSFNQR